MVVRLAMLVIATLVVSCSDPEPFSSESSSQTIETSHSGQAYLIHPRLVVNYEGRSPMFEPQGEFCGYFITKAGPELSILQLERVVRLLLEMRDCDQKSEPCDFAPSHALELELKGQPVDVLLCFECSRLSIRDEMGAVVGFGNFDCVEKGFVKVFEELFPGEGDV